MDTKTSTNRNDALARENSKMYLLKELHEFFEPGETSKKIKALNCMLNSFLSNDVLQNRLHDPQYIQNTVFHLTGMIDFISTGAEQWESFKKNHPETLKKIELI